MKKRLDRIKHEAWINRLVANSRRRYGVPLGPAVPMPDLSVDNPPGLAPTSDRVDVGTQGVPSKEMREAIESKKTGIGLAYNKGPYMYKPRGSS